MTQLRQVDVNARSRRATVAPFQVRGRFFTAIVLQAAGAPDAEFYKKAWLDGYSKGAEDERKKMPRNVAIGFGAADSDEVTCEAAVSFAHQNLNRLNAWERNFIEDMAIQMRHAPSKSFSEKQTALIFKIYRRAGGKI